MDKPTKQLQVEHKRHYWFVVAFVVGIGAIVLYGLFVEWWGDRSDVVVLSESAEEVTAIASSTPWLPSSPPQLLRIPVVGIETEFERPLGLNADGTVEVPESYEEVGWYQYGPTPGELGPAVILGHVDSYQGPAVFYRLSQLEQGDEIFVDREDGQTVKFVVTKLSKHEQAGFPTDQVYGDIDHAGLRLITCSGVYSHATMRYSHNLIVFAEMVEG